MTSQGGIESDREDKARIEKQRRSMSQKSRGHCHSSPALRNPAKSRRSASAAAPLASWPGWTCQIRVVSSPELGMRINCINMNT